MDSAKHPVENVLKNTSAIARRHRTAITVGKMAEELGQNSLPAVLALPVLAAVTPLSGIPMFSSACGVMICLICGQMLLGRTHIWLPRWLGRRRIRARSVRKAAAVLRRTVRWLVRHSRKRLPVLFRPPFLSAIRLVCLICGTLMPLLEIVPITSSLLGAAVGLLAVAMLTRDGLIALLTLGGIGTAAAALSAGLI